MASAKRLLGQRELRFLDGGMGELLFRKGLPSDGVSWSSRALYDKSHNRLVVDSHLEYLRAGAEVITTSNYSVNPYNLRELPNGTARIPELVRLSVELARTAREEFLAESGPAQVPALIAGSVPPLAKTFRYDLVRSEQECLENYGAIVSALDEGGADLFLCETLSTIAEISYAMKSVYDYRGKPCYVSFIVGEDGKLRNGETINQVVDFLKGGDWFNINNIQIVAINCSSPEAIIKAFQQITEETISIMRRQGARFGFYANAYNAIPNDCCDSVTQPSDLREVLTPQFYYQNFIHFMIEKYSDLLGMVGGCCGIFPEHIQHICQSIELDFFEPQVKTV